MSHSMLISGMAGHPALRSHHANRAGVHASLERLATGQRINRASDDPAGLITSENLRAVLSYLESEGRALQRTQSVAAAADAALGEVGELLSRAEALEVRNANDAGLSDAERAANEMEIAQIRETVNRITGSASFNGQHLFDGTLNLTAAGGESLEVGSLTLDPLEGSSADRIEALRAFRDEVNLARGRVGAFEKNMIGAQLDSIATARGNLTAAESMIRDTDYAFEAAEFARFEILSSSSLRILSFLNSRADDVLSILG